MQRSRRAVLGAFLLLPLTLTGCAGTAPAAPATGATTATPTSSPTPIPSLTASAEQVGFGTIGGIGITMTAKQIAAKLRTTATVLPQDGGCAYAVFEPGSGDDPLPGKLSALAATKGPKGPVDVIGFGVSLDDGETIPDGLPTTAEGIGLGATIDQVRAVYPKATVGASSGVPGGMEATLAGPDGLAILFTTSKKGVVESISTGRAEQEQYTSPCG